MQSPSKTIQSVSRAVAVMKACHVQRNGASLGELAKAVSLPRSTVQRIVNTLVKEGMLTNRGAARSIALSPELLSFGASGSVELVERTHPLLRNLAARTGETVDLSRFTRDHAVFVNQVQGTHRLLAVSAVGQTFPLHCTANGKAMLSVLSEAQLSTLLQRHHKAFTPHTLTSASQIKGAAVAARKAGYAEDAEEHTVGISAIGMAFKTAAGEIYALSIPIPTLRFKSVKQSCLQLMGEAVDEIKSLLDRQGD
jgi:DNA-binding IclR family transcriptional regulator